VDGADLHGPGIFFLCVLGATTGQEQGRDYDGQDKKGIGLFDKRYW
jgi:hypothetical protein